ncbi:hypothetical protein MASR2M48_22080 [Spirochaetota bacterium]
MDGIFHWQPRLGNIPTGIRSDEHFAFEKRVSVGALKTKNGIAGVVQHGNLFWDRVPDDVIERVLSIVDSVAH